SLGQHAIFEFRVGLVGCVQVIFLGDKNPSCHKVSLPLHSNRNATVGSTHVARRAGNQQAATPAPSTTKATAAKVSGPRALTPQSSLASTLLAARLAAKPTAKPIPSSHSPMRSTMPITSPRLAPSAIRMLIDDFERRVGRGGTRVGARGKFPGFCGRQGVVGVGSLVGTGRFELPTCRLGGGRSIHLSYVPTRSYCTRTMSVP